MHYSLVTSSPCSPLPLPRSPSTCSSCCALLLLLICNHHPFLSSNCSSIPLQLFHSLIRCRTMGVTWKTPEQTEFLEGLISIYFRFSKGGKLKDFWIVVTKDWFECFPLGDPSNELIVKEGTWDRAIAAAKAKKLKVSEIRNTFCPHNLNSDTADQTLLCKHSRHWVEWLPEPTP